MHAAVNLFNNASFQVLDVVGSPLAVAPPEPYRFVELLQDGVAQAGLSPLAAMSAIRNLYCGVQVEGRWRGLITAFLPPVMAQESQAVLFVRIREQIGQRLGMACLGPEITPEDTRGFILPTEPAFGPEELSGKLGPAEDKIYRLVWARALASQMREAQGEQRTVTVAAGEDCIFKGSAKVLSDKGFLAIYPGCQEHEFLSSPSFLADVQLGQPLRCVQIIPEKTTGLSSEYYSFSGLATDLADFSLVVDGMTVAMLQQMLDNNYLLIMPDGSFRCAENTVKLVTVMNRAFPTMKGIQLSAYLAQTIEEAVSGRKPLAFALEQFEQTMMMRGEVLVKMAMPVAAQRRGVSSRNVIRRSEEVVPVKVQPEKLAQDASVSELPVVSGANTPQPPEFSSEAFDVSPLAVEPATDEVPQLLPAEEDQNFLALDESASAEQVESPELAAATEEMFAEASLDESAPPVAGQGPAPLGESSPAGAEPVSLCPDCGRALLLKEDRFGKYWSCSGHPECQHSESYEKDGGPGLLCPVCRIGSVVTKNTPTGKIFYVCPEQDCAFMAWSKPHAIPCQVCDSPFLVEKRGLDGRVSLRCPKAGCTYTRSLSGTGGEEQEPVGAPVNKKVLVRRVAPGSGGAGGGSKKVRIVRRKK